MIIIMVLPVIFVFGIICLQLSNRINNANFVIDALAKKVNYLEQKADLNKRNIELQNKSIRDMLDVIKKIAEDKETAEPDTKALISGWDADEAEPEDPVKNHIVDICLNGTCEQKQNLIDAMTLQNALLGQIQQCIYPWQPLQSGQFQSCSMLPLWYVNRRLEDM